MNSSIEGADDGTEDAYLNMDDQDDVPEIPKSMRQLEVLISAGGANQSPQGHYSKRGSTTDVNEHHLLVIDTLEQSVINGAVVAAAISSGRSAGQHKEAYDTPVASQLREEK